MLFQSELRDALLEKQKEAGLANNDSKFAEYLDVSRTTWQGIKFSNRIAGLEILHGVAKRYPDLKDIVWAYLIAYPGHRNRMSPSPDRRLIPPDKEVYAKVKKNQFQGSGSTKRAEQETAEV